MREKTCAILSCDPLYFPWGYDEEDACCAALKLFLLNRITVLRSEGVTEFAVVMDSGVGLYAAEIINSLRENDQDMRLTCIVPWEEQATKWTPELRERYFNEQAKCSEVKMIFGRWTADCEISAMLTAIDMAKTVLAVTAQKGITVPVAIHYAVRLHRQVDIIDSGRIQYYA